MNRFGRAVIIGVIGALLGGLAGPGVAQEEVPGADAPAKPKPKPKKKPGGDKYKKSKYFAIVPAEPATYKYGPDGKPVQPPKKKKRKVDEEAPAEEAPAADADAPKP